MKVCIVTGIFPPDIGGPATYVSCLAEALHKIGWDIEVITYSDKKLESTTPFTIHRILRNSPFRTVKTFIKVFVVGKKSDLLFINGLFYPSVLANNFLRKPLIIKLVGDFAWERARNRKLTQKAFDDFQKTPQTGKIKRWQKIRNKCLRKAEKIIVPSEFLKNVVKNWGYEQKIELIYNGVEEDYANEVENISKIQAKTKLGFKNDILLSIGRLTSWKGFDTLIRLISTIERTTKLIIIGDGPERDHLQWLSKSLNVSDRVIFAGRIERNQIPYYLKAADRFILNSGYEGFPHIILEAMAVGTPVVASNIGGNKELIENNINGILVEKDDINQIQSAIARLTSDTNFFGNIVRNARQTAARFTWQKTVTETIALFRNLRKHKELK